MVAILILAGVMPVAGVLNISGLKKMMVWWRRELWRASRRR